MSPKKMLEAVSSMCTNNILLVVFAGLPPFLIAIDGDKITVMSELTSPKRSPGISIQLPVALREIGCTCSVITGAIASTMAIVVTTDGTPFTVTIAPNSPPTSSVTPNILMVTEDALTAGTGCTIAIGTVGGTLKIGPKTF